MILEALPRLRVDLTWTTRYHRCRRGYPCENRHVRLWSRGLPDVDGFVRGRARSERAGEGLEVSVGSVRDARVLITGGDGFIGSHVTHRLVADGAEVHVL